MALFGRQGVNSPVMTLWLRFLRYDRPPGHQRCFSSRCMRPGVRTAEKVRIGARFTFWPENSWLSRIHPFRTSQVSGHTSESYREMCVQKNRA